MSREDRKRKADNDGWESVVVKDTVTEQNGEISCSIEETNRIRAMLGMKPLVVNDKDSDEQKAVRNFKKKQEEETR